MDSSSQNPYDADNVSEASFHSVNSTFSNLENDQKVDENDGWEDSIGAKNYCFNPVEVVESLAKNEDEQDNEKVLDILRELLKIDFDKESVKLACNVHVYQVCSLFLDKYEFGPIIINFLNFFYQVIKNAQTETKYSVDKVIHAKIEVFELFGRFLTRLEYLVPSTDSEIIMAIMKVMSVISTPERIKFVCGLKQFRFHDFFKQFQSMSSRETKDILVAFARYTYELNLQVPKFKQSRKCIFKKNFKHF